jgi:hypothetical protein
MKHTSRNISVSTKTFYELDERGSVPARAGYFLLITTVPWSALGASHFIIL